MTELNPDTLLAVFARDPEACSMMRKAGEGEETVVRIEPSGRGLLVETVTAPGVVQPKTKVSISAKTAARIVELPFKEGDVVKKGDPLVRLDSKDLEALLRGAEARYAAEGV